MAGASERYGGLRRRLVSLAGLVVIVGALMGVLFAAGVLGGQGGGTTESGAKIEDVVFLETPPGPVGSDVEVGPEVGKLAPDFELSDFAGARHRLSDFRGKVVYLNFWATWCVPCEVELPDMQELLDRYPDKLAVIAVNRSEPLDRAKAFLENLPRSDGGRGLSFTVNGLDPNDKLFRTFNPLPLPTMPLSIFIDPNGVITEVRPGLMRLPEMEEAFTAALQSAR